MEEKEKKEKNTEVIVAAEMTEKKGHKKRALLLLLLLLVTGFLLTTSTYAWFTSNTTVSVSNIQVNVATQNGIQLSVDGINWKSILSTTDINSAYVTYPAAKNQMPASLEPVSTGLTIANDYLKMYYGTVESDTSGNYILTSTDVSTVYDNHDNVPEGSTGGTTGKFVMFDMFIKLDGTKDTAFDFYMDNGSGVTASGADSGIKNASRIAYMLLGKTDSGSTTATIQGLSGGTGLDGDDNTENDVDLVYLWEPNFDVHTATGVRNAVDTYGFTEYNETSAPTGVKTGSGNTLLAYAGVNGVLTNAYNVKLADAKTSNVTYGSYFKDVVPSYNTDVGFSAEGSEENNQQIFGLTAGYVFKVRVYFWVEGQDVDCENSASGGNIILNLQLTTNE